MAEKSLMAITRSPDWSRSSSCVRCPVNDVIAGPFADPDSGTQQPLPLHPKLPNSPSPVSALPDWRSTNSMSRMPPGRYKTVA